MMKHLTTAAACLLLASCGTTQLYLDTYVPEESGLNLVKVTDETSNSVIAGSTFTPNAYTYADMTNMNAGISQRMGFGWYVNRLLDVSPDGRQLAYCTRMNKQDNVMVRSAGAQGVATQRTFRNIQSFSWGSDGNIYFSDMNGPNWYICSVNATAGSMMNQLTNGNVKDSDPMLSADGKRLFFTRIAGSGPSIWSLNRENGTLTSCSRGYSVCLIPDDPDAFYCVRNSTTGRSGREMARVRGQQHLQRDEEAQPRHLRGAHRRLTPHATHLPPANGHLARMVGRRAEHLLHLQPRQRRPGIQRVADELQLGISSP